ncbi:MAG: ATP-binding protein [Pseudomonadales bacterium]|nr:ATP-binding protein [Pseudomonadales bacterium]
MNRVTSGLSILAEAMLIVLLACFVAASPRAESVKPAVAKSPPPAVKGTDTDGSRAYPQSTSGAACREAQFTVSRLQADVARLTEWHDAIDSLFKGTLSSDVSLENLFITDLRGVADPRTNARALGEPDGWPKTVSCDALLAGYQATHDDLIWLRQQIYRQQQRVWTQMPEDFREELRQIWASRQRLVKQFEQVSGQLEKQNDKPSQTVLAALRTIHGRLQRVRLSMLGVVPDLNQGVTVEKSRAFFELWSLAIKAKPAGMLASESELAALPAELQSGIRDYMVLARLDAIELRSVLNLVRAILWKSPDGVFRATAREAAGGRWNLLIIETQAVRHRLDRLLSEVGQDYQQDASAEASYTRIAVTALKTLLGLAAIVLLARIARALATPALRLHAHLSDRVRGNRIATQLSRVGAGLPTLLPWLAGWFGLDLLGWFFYRYEFVFLVPAIPLARLYIVYGVGTLLGEWLVLRIAQQAGSYLNAEQSALLETRAHQAAAVVMLPWLLGDLVNIAIGSSQLLDVCVQARELAAFVAIGILLRTREQDLVKALQSVLPPHIDPWVERVLRGQLFWLTGPLAVLPLLAVFGVAFVNRAMLDVDWYRKLYARGFRLRAQTSKAAESTESEADELRLSDYNRWFEPDSLAEGPLIDTGLGAAIIDSMSPWLADKSEENTLVLTGERGIGKSSMLLQLGKELEKNYPGIRVLQLEVPAKTTSPEAVRSLIGELLGTDLGEGPAALVKADAERQPSIVILDNAHGFFLRRVGGLDGWQTLLGLTNARLANIFWLIVINNQSLAYLGNVFRRDYQFSRILRARPWTQNEIRSLIMSRHKRSRFRIRYDDVLLASRGPEAGNVRNAEQRYFSLLWDACRGNPLLALRLWISSLRADGGTVVVGLPAQPSTTALESLPDDFHFVYAALVIHENMTAEELVSVTAMGDGVIRAALKTAQDTGFVQRTAGGRYRLEPIWYPSVRSLLGRKNMLHE